MIMEFAPILSALKRNKSSAILLIAQITLMVAFISNLVSMISARFELVDRPTGMDESSMFAIGFRLTNGVETIPMLRADLATVRGTSGVVDAVNANGYPLRGGGWQDGVSHDPGHTNLQDQIALTAVYAMGQQAVTTLRLKLVEGRDFAPEDVIEGQDRAAPLPGVAIISRALKNQLFPNGNALGQQIYLTTDSKQPIVVIGVVERLQSPTAAETTDEKQSQNSMILPTVAGGEGGLFLVRARVGTVETTMHAVQNALLASNPNRIFGRLRPYSEVRKAAYAKDLSMALAFSILLSVLVLITALAIAGLTSFWVVRRKIQIGIRRALGASRGAITRYFLLENAILCIAGAAMGAVAAQLVSLWLWSHLGIVRIQLPELLICGLVVVTIGQLAAMVPALQAARVPPSQALRSL
jgi:putative ABC transport system permease protein